MERMCTNGCLEDLKSSKRLKVGLYNLEPNIVNTAMMQVAQYHRNLHNDIYIYLCFMISMM